MPCQQALKTFHNFWTTVTFLIFVPNLSSKAFWVMVSSVQTKQTNKTSVLQETGIWECFWYMHGDLFSPFWSWGWGRCRSRRCASCCTRPGWRHQWSPAWGRPSTTLITNDNIVGHFHAHLHGTASEAATLVNVIHLAFACKPSIASCRWWSRPLFLWPLLHIYCTYLLYIHLLYIFFMNTRRAPHPDRSPEHLRMAPTALVSASKQTHCALVVCSSEWVLHYRGKGDR